MPSSPLNRKLTMAVLMIFLLLFSSFFAWRGLLYLNVERKLARVRAAGLPLSGSELNRWPAALPDSKNGALVLTQAFALLRGQSKEVTEPGLLERTNLWGPATTDLVQAYVQTNQSALAIAQDTLKFSAFRFPLDFAYGPDTELPHLARLKTIAQIAALKAALESQTGQSNQWPETVALQLMFAQSLDQEPIVISYLVRCAIINMAVKATERSLNQVTPANDACKQLQNTFIQIGSTNLLPSAFVGERATTIPVFRLSWKEIQSLSQREDGTPHKPQRYSGRPAAFLWLTGIFERDLDFYLKTMEASISLAALPSPQNLQLTNYFESASTVARKKSLFLSSMLLPSFSRVIVREASTQAALELAATALAVERFRQERGRLPVNLQELTPEFLDQIPRDPFDGEPLRYRVLTKGYCVYSIGADGHDDGGKEPPQRRKPSDNSSYDITFIVEH